MQKNIQRFAIFYVIVLTLLLEFPGSIREFTPAGKMQGFEHLIAFFFLGFLVELSREKKTMLFWVSMLCLYALGTEVLQGLLNPICYRFFDWNDIVQNVAGIWLGTLIGHFCRPVRR